MLCRHAVELILIGYKAVAAPKPSRVYSLLRQNTIANMCILGHDEIACVEDEDHDDIGWVLQLGTFKTACIMVSCCMP